MLYQCDAWCPRSRICANRRLNRSNSPIRNLRKSGSEYQAIGGSRDGPTSKIVALVGAVGKGISALFRKDPFGALLTDCVFDATALLAELNARGATAIILPKSNRKQQCFHDADACKRRHRVENYPAKIKNFRGIATCRVETDLQLSSQPEPRRNWQHSTRSNLDSKAQHSLFKSGIRRSRQA